MNLRTPKLAHPVVAVILLALLLPGCSTWQPMRPQMAQTMGQTMVAPDPTECVLVKLRDGGKVEIILGAVDADSVRGWHNVGTRGHWSEPQAIKRGAPIAIPRSKIDTIETRQFSAEFTVGGALVVIGLLGAGFVIAMSHWTPMY